jgi:hypothetical protein
MRHVWTGFALVAVMAVPMLSLTQQSAFAAGAPKAEWRTNQGTKTKAAPKAAKATKAVKAVPAPPPIDAPPTAVPEEASPAAPVAVLDQSQEVLDIDFAMASAIATQGPKDGYTSALSDEGVLYDANGASPAGKEAAASRFGSFPADVILARTPERALAAGGSGSSWGTYTIKRGETILSAGRYISVWRREAAGWKMISELAAGRTIVPPPQSSTTGVLPRRPTSPGRATPSPVGVPLTVPTPPVTPAAEETPPPQ